MREETERQKVKKERILNKLPYDDIKEKLLEGYNSNSRINRVLNDQLNKFNTRGLKKKGGFNVPITTSKNLNTNNSMFKLDSFPLKHKEESRSK